MSYILKKLSQGDTDLAQQLFWFYQVDDEIESPTAASNDYLVRMLMKDDFHVIVALQDNELIGGITAYEIELYEREIKEMFLYEIAVKPGYRKMGVATALIESLKDICRTRDIKEMYVGTSTDNHPAMKLYSSTGGDEDKNIAWFVYQIGK